jgi:hypothetical protein
MAMLFAGATVSIPPRIRMDELVAHVNGIGATAIFLVPTMIRLAGNAVASRYRQPGRCTRA